MKTSVLNKIMTNLILPDKFTKKGRLAYYIVSHKTGLVVLVGLYLDNSIDSTSFIVYYFVQCLYEPFGALNFSLGERIGTYWSIDSTSELQKGINEIANLDELNTFDDFLMFLNNHPFYGDKLSRDSYLAFTYFILGHYDKSLFYLDEIISTERDVNFNSCSKEVKNAQLIKSFIIDRDYDKGISQLLQWQSQTIKDLGLKICNG